MGDVFSMLTTMNLEGGRYRCLQCTGLVHHTGVKVHTHALLRGRLSIFSQVVSAPK